MSLHKILTLSTGATVPQLGLGTWLSKPKEVEHAVEFAIRNGYRHIDAALIYENQDEVGAALKKVIPSVVKREELFITSKLWNNSHDPAAVEKDLDLTLSQLGTDYLDLYLIHWPVCFPPGPLNTFDNPENPTEVLVTEDFTLVETWQAMIKLKETGKVKAIGVSNFTIEYIEGIVKATGVVPTCNQIERHPLLPQYDLVEYCRKNNILVTAYSPLGNNITGLQKLVDYPEVKAIAERLKVTPAQVLIAWGAYEEGVSVIPKSVQEERILSNFQQVQISKEDYDAVTAIGKNKKIRFNTPHSYTPPWDINIFGEPSEASATRKVRIA
ncbi:NADP-dependent oxidoreductase domain-containing protein [Irpex rosettiformis]|uniref:NADP-dependent oxidoreductase domain-containing protein n=1 Tax=Irpex rosettiformis TaxID=378272 RepID=A0ACB8U978_9APHY|nr:NADP-dependent oxidoreductase domain-containing protein [Irpex rosettiformis]